MFDRLTGNGAVFSPDMKMRFLLWRTWNEALPRLGWVMLNPSIAGADVDDPTIRKCIGFGERHGAGGIAVVNLSPWIAADPAALLLKMAEGGEGTAEAPIANGRAFQRLAYNCQTIVCAWGSNGAYLRDRAVAAISFLRGAGKDVRFLGQTKNGEFKHPLYVP